MAEKTPATTSKTKVRAAALKAKAGAGAGKLKGGVSGHGSGFVDFIREQGVIGLAVGLAIGAAAGDTVKKLVEAFINPIVQFIVGSGDKLATAHTQIELWGRHADFQWGAFVSSAISLLATAFVIYLIIHGLKLDKLDKKKG